MQEEKKEVDPKQAKRDKEKIDRLIAEQAEEQRLGHKLYKGEMGGPEAEKKKHEEFVDRMVDKGYTSKQVRLLSEWYLRVRKSQ